MSKNVFKNYIDKQVNERFIFNLRQSKKRKIQDMLKTIKTDKKGKILMQPYLRSDKLALNEKRALFMLRSRSFHVKSNYSNMYKNDDMRCRICRLPDTFEDDIQRFF